VKTEFFKYQGNGNDFIILDNRSGLHHLSTGTIAALCDRHFGIGADGLMLLEEMEGYDFSLKYFNSDGKESTMCGNGGRCMTAFASRLGLCGKTARFLAVDGEHESVILQAGDSSSLIRLKMKDTAIGQTFTDGYFIDTGSPHFVKFVPSADEVDLLHDGRALRNDSRFAPGGCNVNFVERLGNSLKVRTYERGVENETLSCGTGVTAAVLVNACLKPTSEGSCHVQTRGGEFNVLYIQAGTAFTGVFLEGPAEFVFKGEIRV